MGRLPADKADVKKRTLDALMELQSVRPFEDVSVVELCKRAYLSRQTFYRHYQSKEEVYLEHLDHLLEKLVSHERGGSSPEDVFDALGLLLADNRDFLSCLFRASLDSRVLHRFERLLESMGGLNGLGDQEQSMQVFLAGGIFNTMKRWAVGKASEDASSYVTTIRGICAPVIYAAFLKTDDARACKRSK